MHSRRINLLIFLLPLFTFSQNNYDISLIPEDLKKDASAVVRHDDVEIEFIAQDKMLHRATFVVTVFNKSMDDYNSLSLGFLAKTKTFAFGY